MIKKITKAIPLTIVTLGIVIRLVYAFYFGYDFNSDYFSFKSYQHDWPAHQEYIEYVAKHLSLPNPAKGFEFPQQPLYYIIAGIIFKITGSFKAVILLSTLASIGALIFAYFLAKKLFTRSWLQSFVAGILAFTPAFIFQSGMLNNDPLAAFFSAGAFLFLIWFLKDEKLKPAVLAIIFAFLAAFTKISAGLILIVILVALLWKKYRRIPRKTALMLACFALLAGILCLGFALFRAYNPETKNLRFVESYVWPEQQTNPKNPAYFYRFDFPSLVKEGQAYVFGNKNVSRYLPTFLYGSFISGEYSYENPVKTWPDLKILMQIMVLLALIFPLGFLVNFLYVKKWDIVDYVFLLAILINLTLVVAFLFKYPNVCNSDFRYFSPVFLALLAFSGLGISRAVDKFKKLNFVLPVLIFFLFSAEICWFVARTIIKIIFKV